MAAIVTSSGATLSITPLLDQDVAFLSYKSIEKLNGEMAKIEVNLKAFKDGAYLVDKQHIKLVNENGYSIECDAYIYSLEYVSGRYTVKMMPTPGEFTRSVKTTTYKGGESAINIYPGRIDKTVKSDILSTTPLYQKSESDYQFLTRVLHGYKHNAIFAYTLGGLVVRDLNTFKAALTLNRKGNTIVDEKQSQSITDPKRYRSQVEILERYTNHIKVRIHGTVMDVNKEYETLLSNYGFFERFNQFRSLYNFKTKELYDVGLCEGVNYFSEETHVERTILSSRIITIEGTALTVDYSLKSIDPLNK